MKHKSIRYTVISVAFVALLSVTLIFAGLHLKKTGAESSDYFLGAATGLMLVALAHTARIIKMSKNAKYRKKQEIEQNDERIISIRNRAMAVSYYATIMITAAASLISAALGNMENASHFSMLLSLSAVVYLVAYLVLSHKE